MRQRQPGTLTVWQVVGLARHAERPYALDYIKRLAPDFVEYHGDRLGADDAALVGGIGTWNGRTTMFLGQQKGRAGFLRVAREGHSERFDLINRRIGGVELTGEIVEAHLATGRRDSFLLRRGHSECKKITRVAEFAHPLARCR